MTDALNADSITSDAGVSIAAGSSYTGAGAVILSSATATGLTINSGTTGTLAIGDDASAETINIGTGAAVKTLTIGSSNTTSSTLIQSGTGDITIDSADKIILTDFGGAGCSALETNASGELVCGTDDGGAFSGEVDDTTNDALTFTSDDASPPAGTVNAIFRDNTGDLNINTVTGKTLNVQIAGADEYNFSASGLEFNSNDLTGVGTNITSSGALTIATAASGNLTLDSDSGTLILGAGTNTLVNTDGATALLLNPTGNLQFQSANTYIDSSENLVLNGYLDVNGGDGSDFAGGVTFNDDVDLVLAGTENLIIGNTTAAAGDIVALSFTTANATDGLDIAVTSSADAAADTINGLVINWTETTDADVFNAINIANTTSTNSTTTALRIGTGWDTGLSIESGGMTISGGTFTYATGNRQDRKMVLSAEYPGASLFGDGSTNTGDMTSDYTNSTTGDRHTYYEWDSGEAALQDYTIVVRFTLPDNFGVWDATSAIVFDYITETAVLADTQIDISVFLESGAAADATDNDNASATWAETTIDDADLGECNAAGETCVIEILMQSRSNTFARIGDITLNYDADF